jgi:hypothetical protein
MQIVIERHIGKLTTHHPANFNKPEILDHAGEGPGEILGITSNTEHPPAVDVAKGLQGEVLTDAGAQSTGHSTETGDVQKGRGVPDASGGILSSVVGCVSIEIA